MVLLMVPVTISVAKILNIKPVFLILAEIFASNIGGATTLIGDPSGKDSTRKILKVQDIKKNIQSIKKVFNKILDTKKMKNESASFLGKHDLNAFRSAHCQSKSSIRTIDDIIINIKNEIIFIEVVAKSFLHSQVRIMVGTLVDIAKGNINISILDIINTKNREVAGQTAPANGLYLKKIGY